MNSEIQTSMETASSSGYDLDYLNDNFKKE
jgi:hypothetical protein